MEQKSKRPVVVFTLSLGLTFFWTAASATDAPSEEHGKTVFGQCSVCHSVDGSASVGPTLKGVLGRTSGAVQGFHYSRAMTNAKLTWDAKTLDAYLANPQTVVPGNVMPFSGLPDGKERADLIAYLKTIK